MKNLRLIRNLFLIILFLTPITSSAKSAIHDKFSDQGKSRCDVIKNSIENLEALLSRYSSLIDGVTILASKTTSCDAIESLNTLCEDLTDGQKETCEDYENKTSNYESLCDQEDDYSLGSNMCTYTSTDGCGISVIAALGAYDCPK
jgi:hypothetical protein